MTALDVARLLGERTDLIERLMEVRCQQKTCLRVLDKMSEILK